MVKKIEICLEGVGEGLLMNSAQGMIKEATMKKNPAKQYDHKQEAENVAYRNKKGELIIPSRCMKACILNASSWYKFGKKSAKPIIAGCTEIEPVEITLLDKKGKPIKDYEVDLRPVVIQRSRIIRARPLVREWRAKFDLIYDEQLLQDTEVLSKILEESGKRCGILDNRPQKSFGENGKFAVIKFLPKE